MTSAFQNSYAPQNLNVGSGTKGVYSYLAQHFPVNRSSWIEELEERFHELMSLPIGWDGYAGVAVSLVNASFAASLLESLYVSAVSAPSLVPGSDGTLQIEWHEQNFDIELDILGPGFVVATRCNHLADQEEFCELSNDFTIVSNWIKDLVVTEDGCQLIA